MSESGDLCEMFEAIVRANRYMVLATADAAGLPWASPVWFATSDCREFFWASSPEVRHSRNLAARPELAISIHDSAQAPGTGQGAYVSAIAVPVPESELDAGLAVYSRVSREQGLSEWSRSDVTPPAKHRLYRAATVERFILGSGDTRTSVPLMEG